MSEDQSGATLSGLSDQLADIVEKTEASVVRVDDGTRLSATGLIWSSDGVIVATSHGVERDEELLVVRNDGTRHAATVVGRDPESDIAVLRIDATDLHAISRTSEARVGSIVLALGTLQRQGVQATMGIINSKVEAQDAGRPEYILHTDAALLPGFSGGALVNTSGELVGMLNLMFGRGSGVALGTSLVSNVVEALLAHGKIRRGFLGIGTQVVSLPENLRQALTISQESGLMIVHVQANGPAETSGLTIGDVLLTVNGIATRDSDELRRGLRRLSAGQQIKLKLLRGGSIAEINAVLGEEK